MAIVMIEGFDTQQYLVGEGKWSEVEDNPTYPDLQPVFIPGRLGGYSTTPLYKSLRLRRREPPLKWVVGVAVKAVDTPFSIPLVGLRNAYENTDNFSFVVGTNEGRLFAAVNAPYSHTAEKEATQGGILTPPSQWLTTDLDPILLPTRWVYIEVEIVPSAVSIGSVSIYVDEELWFEKKDFPTLYGDGCILQVGSNFVWEGDTRYAPVLIDDVYILDSKGIEYTKPLGDVYVATLLPVSDYNRIGWASNTGEAPYSCVDDAGPHDGDKTYIWTDLDGAMHGFKMSSIEIPSPIAVQLTAVASKLRLAAGWVGLYADLEGNLLKTDAFAVSRGYKAYSTIWEKNPLGTKWSSQDILQTEFGVFAKVDWAREEK